MFAKCANPEKSLILIKAMVLFILMPFNCTISTLTLVLSSWETQETPDEHQRGRKEVREPLYCLPDLLLLNLDGDSIA